MLGKHINIIDQHLKVVAEARLHPDITDAFLLQLELFYDNKRAGMLDYTLQGYDENGINELVRGIKRNAFLMRSIDEYLCGDEM